MDALPCNRFESGSPEENALLLPDCLRADRARRRTPCPHDAYPPSWRRPGGGRKRATEKDRTLLEDLDALVEPMTRGDPDSPLRWTSKSLRHLADELRAMGHDVSYALVGRLLEGSGYSLQANRKTREGAQHEVGRS